MTAKEYKLQALEKLSGNWAASLAVGLVAALLGGSLAYDNIGITVSDDLLYYLPRFVQSILGALAGVSASLGLIQFIAGGMVQLGYGKYLLSQHDGRERDLSDLLTGVNRFGQGFAQSFLRGLYTILWGLLLFVPGIIAGLSYFMTPYIMAENPDMTATEAIRASKDLMYGHKADLFWLQLSFIGWDFLCLLTCGIGNLFLRPYKTAAFTAFYRSISPAPVIHPKEIPMITE